jgi:hypothetical protein
MKFHVQRTGAPVQLGDEHFYLGLLGVMTGVTVGLVATVALLLHRNFLTIACDTAVLQSAIVNTLHGHWFANNGAGGPNVLGSHTTFFLLAVIPFYVIAPFPETLFVLQVAGVYTTVLPLFLLARQMGQKPLTAFVVAVSALASPLLLHDAFAPFHLETWIPAAALWSYYFYLRHHLAGFLASIGVAVCCGEQAALIFIALGAALLLAEDGLAWRKPFGRIALLSGLLWLALAIGVTSPLASRNYPFNIFAYNYAEWGINSAAGLPAAIAHQPARALSLLLSPTRWAHIASLVGIPLLAAFFSRRSLILLAPVPAYLLMSDQEFFLYFHAYYYSFAYFAGCIGLLLFLQRREPPDRAGIMMLASTLFFTVVALCFAAGYYFHLSAGADEGFSLTLREAFAKIPPGATVYTPHRYSVYLSNREYFVIGDLKGENLDFNAMMNEQYPRTHVHPGQVDYIVSDYMTDQCGWRGGYPSTEQFNARSDAIERLIATKGWSKVFDQSNVVILQRTAGEPSPSLPAASPNLPGPAKK